ALSRVLRQTIQTVGCGRTDTGVHARQFFAHFDLNSQISISDPGRIIYSVNALLPSDISIYGLFPVPADAHARFDAISRSYEYFIHFCKDPFRAGFSWQLRARPDVKEMNRGAGIIRAYKDF